MFISIASLMKERHFTSHTFRKRKKNMREITITSEREDEKERRDHEEKEATPVRHGVKRGRELLGERKHEALGRARRRRTRPPLLLIKEEDRWVQRDGFCGRKAAMPDSRIW